MIATKEHQNSLYRGLKNALKETIRHHGPITEQNYSSALKRIFGTIINHQKNIELSEK